MTKPINIIDVAECDECPFEYDGTCDLLDQRKLGRETVPDDCPLRINDYQIHFKGEQDMNRKQIGTFSLDEKYVRDEPEKAAKLFEIMRAVVVRAESIFTSRMIVYTAIASCFEENSDWCVAPEYSLEIITDNDGWPQEVHAKRGE